MIQQNGLTYLVRFEMKIWKWSNYFCIS